MTSYILRIIAILYLVTSSEGGILLHKVGGAIEAAKSGKAFFKGAIISAANNIAVDVFNKALEDFWKRQFGPDAPVPKAIKASINGDVNLKGGARVDVDSFIRFKYYADPNTVVYADVNINNTIKVRGSLRGRLRGGLGGGLTSPPGELITKPTGSPKGGGLGGGLTQESAKETSIKDSVTSLFFAEEDLSLGKKMNVHFPKSTNTAPFLPRDLVDKLSLNPKNLNEILIQFNLTSNSTEAEMIKETLKYCGDNKSGQKCCNSLETMVEYAKSIVGNTAKAISSNVEKDTKMEYKVQGVKKLPCKPQTLLCHKVPFPSAVFYCLKIDKVVVYMAQLEGSDRSTVNAPATCHESTNSWDHDHLDENVHAKDKKGPICHFLLGDDVLWIGS